MTTVRRSRSGRRRRRATVRIESIASGGEGVGKLPDGRVVFVHRTAPADRVEVELIQERPRWTRGRLLRVLEPSPDRREVPCPHYERCGGCTLEHLQYPAQLSAKRRIVADALTRLGGVPVDEPEVVPSPREHRYRNRVSFTLRRGASGEVFAGFHALHDPDTIVPIDGRCLLPEEAIARVWDGLRAHWGPDANRLPSGEQLRLTLRATAKGSVALLVEGGYSHGRPHELVERVDGLDAIWIQSASEPPTLLAGSPTLPEVWGEERFAVGGTAFLQVNRWAAALLEEHVLATIGDVAGRRVVDAYCGVGVHARRLARAGARVVGLELHPDAVRLARLGAPDGARFVEGRVEDLLPSVLPADLIILNPPRAGVDAAVVASILEAPPSRIIYVSCDPATLARDLRRLSGSFELASIRCFDLFPQTAHVESVVELRRRS